MVLKTYNKKRGGFLKGSVLKDFLKNSYKNKNDQSNNLHGFKRNEKLSGNRVQVYHNNENNKTIVAHRGTKDLNDVITDVKLALFPRSYKNSKRYQHSKNIQEQAEQQYGKDNITTIGHSLGSKLASDLGKNTKEVITYNKPTFIRDLFKKPNPNETHIRTKGDVVSLLSPYFDRTKTKTINKNNSITNPLDAHNIDKLDDNEIYGNGLKINKKKALSNFDIISICNKLNLPLVGVFMKDELPNKKVLGNYVVNFENHNQDGSHWVAMKLTEDACYFGDSYGTTPPEKIYKFLKKYYNKIYFNNQIYQDYDSVLCGYFSIGILHYIDSHNKGNIFDRANEFINMFQENTKKNDNILIKYFKGIKRLKESK